MLCPVCKEPMVVLELNEVEIDYCPVCEGIWLDEGELELLLENASEKDSLIESFTPCYHSGEKRYRCPICSKKMNKIIVSAGTAIVIDKCRKNHGLWFDKGELQEIIRTGTLDKENKILSLLNQMFKHKLK